MALLSTNIFYTWYHFFSSKMYASFDPHFKITDHKIKSDTIHIHYHRLIQYFVTGVVYEHCSSMLHVRADQ